MKDLFGNELQIGDKVMVLHISSLGYSWPEWAGGHGVVRSVMNGLEWDMEVNARKAGVSACKAKRSSGNFYMKWYEVVKLDADGVAMMPSDMTLPRALQLCKEKSECDQYVMRGLCPPYWSHMGRVRWGAQVFEQEIPF